MQDFTSTGEGEVGDGATAASFPCLGPGRAHTQPKKKKFAVVLSALSLVYMVVPDPSDIVPIIGWLDEGLAAALLLWSMRTLGITPGALMSRFKSMPAPQQQQMSSSSASSSSSSSSASQ